MKLSVIGVFINLRQILVHILSFSFYLIFISTPEIVAGNASQSPSIQEIVTKAKNGDAYYQGLLAHHYSVGHIDLEVDQANALKWAKMSCDKGHPIGQFLVGYLHEKGLGIQSDKNKAKDLFQKCSTGIHRLAAEGDGEAQVILGLIYAWGLEGQKSSEEAVKWFRKAAENANSMGQYNYAFMLSSGDGVPKNVQDARKWYEKAVKQGNLNAYNNLGRMYENEQNAFEAVKLYRAAAERGHSMAQNNLGYAYQRGVGVQKNETEAMKWYHLAANQGESLAQINLAWLLYSSRTPDYQESAKWFRMAAEQGDLSARWFLREMLRKKEITKEQANISTNTFHFVERNPESPVSIAIADIQNIGEAWDKNMIKTGIRNHIISDLVQNYDCVVLTRSSGCTIVGEDDLRRMASISDATWRTETLPAADCVVSVVFWASGKGEEVEGSIVILGLSETTAYIETKTRFLSSSIYELHKTITGQIVKQLSLNRRISTGTNKDGSLKPLVWTVLPFLRLDGKDMTDTDNLALEAERTFQENKFAGKLVDRASLDKVLNEIKIGATAGANENIGGAIGRLVGADILLMGRIDKTKKSLRIDLHVVDCKTAIVLDARSKECTSSENLKEDTISLCRDLAVKGIMQKSLFPRAVSIWQKRLEAQFYLDLNNLYEHYLQFQGGYTITTSSRLAYTMNNCEAAYIMDHENPCYTVPIARDLRSVADAGNYKLTSTSYSSALSRKAVNLLDAMLSRKAISPEMNDPLIWRADGHVYIEDWNGALSLVNEHLSKYPDVNYAGAMYCKTLCTIKLRRFDEATSLLEERKKKCNDKRNAELTKLITDTQPANEETLYQRIKFSYEDNKSDISQKSAAQQFEDMKQFCKLQLKFETPENALKILQDWRRKKYSYARRHSSLRPLFLSQEAVFLKALNRKAEAAQKCREAIDLIDYFKGIPKEFRDKTTTLLSEIEIEIGKTPNMMQTAGDTLPIPRQYRFCVIPVSGVDTGIVVNVASALEKFFKTRMTILPPVNTPDSLPRDDDRGYSPRELINGLNKNTAVPDDTLFVAFITNKKIISDMNNPKNEIMITMRNPTLLSYISYWHGPNPYYINRAIHTTTDRASMSFLQFVFEANGFVDCFNMCSEYPCLCSSGISCLSREGLYLLCPKCQELYKKADFDKIHSDLMDYLKKAGAKIIKSEKE